MLAPDSRWAPGVLPFSITATGTSPSFSITSGSCSSRCIRRFAQASPAGPPPTIAMPTSMRSSAGSVGGPTNSLASSTGGGNSAGATPPMPRSAALLRLNRLGQLRHDLMEIAHDAQVAELEDRGVRVLVDRDDVLRGLHADLVLDRAGDAGGQVELRRDRLAGLADLGGVGVPAGVDHGARGGDGGVAAERLGQRFGELEALRLAEAAAAGDEDVGALDVHVGAALLAALDHLGLGRPGRELDLDVLDRGAAAALLRLEGVEAADDDALVFVGRRRDARVAQDRALGGELAVDDVDLRDLHRHAGAQARGQAGADLEAEQAAAEDGVLMALLAHDLRHHVDHRLSQAFGRLGAEDLRHAVVPQ